MQIEVIDEQKCADAQTRAYAEYRVFAVLAPFAPAIRDACIELGRRDAAGTDRVTCTVTVDLRGTGARRIHAIGAHPYAAIDRAVVRVKRVLAAARRRGVCG